MVYDLTIIGGGPAGVTAGIYAAREKLNTLLITKDFGGQLSRKAVAIENYPGFEAISGWELIQKFEKQLKKHDIDIERSLVIKIKKRGKKFFILTKDKKQFETKTIIIASGADPRLLEVPGEKKFIGRGVSYCVLCDGALFSNKIVAVIGGGDAGFEAAVSLSKYAKKVYLLEFSSVVRADKINQSSVKKIGKIEIITSASLKKIKGKKFVDSLVYQDRKTGKNLTLPVEGVFVEIGSQPATSFAKDLVNFNEKDEIIVEPETYRTKTPGLFAVGDCNNGKFKQIIIAGGEGCKALLEVCQYLKNFKKTNF